MLRLRVTVPDDAPVPPTAEQVAAYRALLAHGAVARDAVLSAVFALYPQFLDDCFDADDVDFPALAAAVPELDSPDQPRSPAGLGNLFLLSEAAEGVGYVWFEFGCEREAEHGLGVPVHRDRVVAVGQADTALGGHSAARDARHGWRLKLLDGSADPVPDCRPQSAAGVSRPRPALPAVPR